MGNVYQEGSYGAKFIVDGVGRKPPYANNLLGFSFGSFLPMEEADGFMKTPKYGLVERPNFHIDDNLFLNGQGSELGITSRIQAKPELMTFRYQSYAHDYGSDGLSRKEYKLDGTHLEVSRDHLVLRNESKALSVMAPVDHPVSRIPVNQLKINVLKNVGGNVRFNQDGTTYIDDAVDRKYIDWAANYTGPRGMTRSLGDDGIGSYAHFVYPNYVNGSRNLATFDTDRDGMPNTWEEEHGLNPDTKNNNEVRADRNWIFGNYIVKNSANYTNLEMYLADIGGDFHMLAKMGVQMYALNVENGGGADYYASGTTVAIAAAPAPSGKRFLNWATSGGGIFTSATSASTTFTMPANAVTVTAIYVNNTATLTVKNGTGDGNYARGAVISIVADSASAGQRFLKWTTSNGGSFANVASARTTFVMPEANVTVSAKYENIPTRILRLTGDLDFGEVTVGNISQRKLTIHNDGDSVLSVSNVYFDVAGNIYSGTWKGDIAAGQSVDVSLSFSPKEIKYYPNTVYVDANGTAGSNERSVSGSGVESEGGSEITGWDLYDAYPDGASISNVIDPNDPSNRVIKLTGSARNNGYRYTFPLAEINNFAIKWNAKFNESYTVYVSCETTQGHRYLTYTAGLDEQSKVGSGDEYVHHDLGGKGLDGQWTSVVRNLQEDLSSKQVDTQILEVTALLIRGSGYIDDIKLVALVSPVGWDVYDNTPIGASIRRVEDPDNDTNRVIELDGAGKSNGYRYTLPNPERTNFAMKWDMRYDEAYTVYIACRTTQGHRYLAYASGLPASYQAGENDEYLRYALGNDTRSGSWTTVTRNLQQDLWSAQPYCDIIEVYAFLIRGSGYIDNIENMAETTDLATTNVGISSSSGQITYQSAARAVGPFPITDNGRMKSIVVYHEGDQDTGATLSVAVYDDNNGVPGSRLGVASDVQVDDASGWQEVLLPAGIPVRTGQKVWLAWDFSVNPGMRYSWGEGDLMRYTELNGSLEDEFVVGKSSPAQYSLYARYNTFSPIK